MRNGEKLSHAWVVVSWTRHETNERGEDVWIPGAQIQDRDAGVIYRGTIGRRRGGPWLTHLSITLTRPGDAITAAFLARVPTRALADAIADHMSEGVSVIISSDVDRVHGDPPDLAELAAEYPRHKRTDLARRYGVSPSTLDRWVAKARRQGLLPPATTGRPRSQTPGESQDKPNRGRDRT